jgi:hypothetical protein
VEDIQIKGVQTPIFIRLGDRGDPFENGGPEPPMGSLRNVVLRNITAEAASGITSSITGIPGFPVRNITLQNIDLTVPGGEGPVPDGYIVPENISSKPGFDMFGEYLPAYGLYIRHADSLILDHVCITTQNPDQRPEIHWEDTGNVKIIHCLITSVFSSLSFSATIFPNPVKQQLQISLKDSKTDHGNFVIADVLGTAKQSGSFSGKHFLIDVADLANGIYFLTVFDNGDPVAVGKFVKR